MGVFKAIEASRVASDKKHGRGLELMMEGKDGSTKMMGGIAEALVVLEIIVCNYG